MLNVYEDARQRGALVERLVESDPSGFFFAERSCWVQIEPGQPEARWAPATRVDAQGRAVVFQGEHVEVLPPPAAPVRLRVTTIDLDRWNAWSRR